MSTIMWRCAMAVAALVIAPACVGQHPDARKNIQPVYNKASGRLELLTYDSDGDNKVDMWSYMDGARVLRIEIDKNADGRIDRWEYYRPDGTLEKVGLSRRDDGKPDSWAYAGADGSTARIEVSTRRDDRVDRIEYFQHGAMLRAEEDTDADGKPDKWETYDGSRIASVSFDLTHSGRPERRLLYGVDGTVRLEVDRAGDGHFAPLDSGRTGVASRDDIQPRR